MATWKWCGCCTRQFASSIVAAEPQLVGAAACSPCHKKEAPPNARVSMVPFRCVSLVKTGTAAIMLSSAGEVGDLGDPSCSQKDENSDVHGLYSRAERQAMAPFGRRRTRAERGETAKASRRGESAIGGRAVLVFEGHTGWWSDPCFKWSLEMNLGFEWS